MEQTLNQASEREKNHDWLSAVKFYEKALSSGPEKDFLKSGEIQKRIGYAFFRASTQVESPEEFRRLCQLAVEAYRTAAELFEKEGSVKSQGKGAHCRALADYTLSWLAPNPSKKRKALDECLEFGKQSLEAYKKAGDELSYGKMCNDLLLCFIDRLYVASDGREMKKIAQEGVDCANKTIEVLSKLGDKNELLRTYFTASLQSWYAANISEEEEKQKELVQKSLSYSQKALELSKEVGNPYFTAMANWAATSCTLLFTEKVESALGYAEEMLKQAMIVKDNYLKGVASYLLGFVTDWMMLREPDPDKKKEGHTKIIKYAEDAIRYLQLVSQDYFIAQTYLFYAESYSSLAREFEASLEEKRTLLAKAVETGRKGLEHATISGSPDATGSTLHALSKALHFYSNLETRREERAKLLEEAVVHRQEYINIVERAFPSNDWISGVGKNYKGLLKLELAKVETDKDKKRITLESAVSDMEEGVSRCRKYVSSRPVPSVLAAVAGFEDSFGGILNELYFLTDNAELLKKAIDVYEGASEKFKKVNLPSRVAESYWKMAKNQDRLGEHQKAAENFENAFEEYKIAAQRIQNFADFYLDYATYMNAWSEIEKAKFAHEREEYATATKHYEKIANLLKSTRLWSYLSLNFLAWSLLEQAEDLSRKESSDESAEAFKKAAELFIEARKAFEQEIDKTQNVDEKEKAVELGKASTRRKDYCLARISLEEAIVFDRKGDHIESAEKYDSAAAAFELMLETEADQREIKPIATMCRAWQKMKMADARDSAELYHEASELFLKAKEHGTKGRTVMLACGNSAFCKALEHGTQFGATRKTEDFTKAKQYLESAANYYMKADFDNASLWTNATETLFDAYDYMLKAETEVDPKKKTETYLLAEKCLERSVRLYERAGYVGKRDEVHKTLSKVKEKREFALSLGELLTAPSDISSTRLISAPGMTVEEPVGLLKFEHAFVEGNLIAHQKDIVVGEDFGLEIQLVNLGKNTAFLIRVEEIIPKGFDLIEKPVKCVVNNGFLNFKAKKLAALETEEMKLTLKPRKKGKFVLKPKLQYMDETGEYKSCELEEVTVTVKELGILGWLRGQG